MNHANRPILNGISQEYANYGYDYNENFRKRNEDVYQNNLEDYQARDNDPKYYEINSDYYKSSNYKKDYMDRFCYDNDDFTKLTVEDIQKKPEKIGTKRFLLSKINMYDEDKEQSNKKASKIGKNLKSAINLPTKSFELHRKSLKIIEERFGPSVMEFFRFIKLLISLNIVTCIFMVTFVIIPIFFDPQNRCGDSKCCESYFNTKLEETILEYLLDVVQGTRFLERTPIFYGYYTNGIMNYTSSFHYNLPVAYLGVNLWYLLLSLILIVIVASRSFKEAIIKNEGLYSSIILGSWNFSIDNRKAADEKHEIISKEIKNTFQNDVVERERKNAIEKHKKLYFILRAVINIFIVSLLVAAAVAIYEVFEFSNEKLINYQGEQYMKLFYEFAPSLTMVLLNTILPTIFQTLVKIEKYNQILSLRIILIRTVFLKLFSLCILFASLLNKISCSIETTNEACFNPDCNVPVCWETYIGQQIYKLTITEFLTALISTFIVNYTRSRLGKINTKFTKMIGQQIFNLPMHVLDIVYLQTLCWFGTFFAPFLPLLYTIFFFSLFHIKKFACLVNSNPSPTPQKITQSKSMFAFILLLCFPFALLPVAYSVGILNPSKSCGPFRDFNITWHAITIGFYTFPKWLQEIAFFLPTSGFVIPLFLILFITIYYYCSIISANNGIIKNLKLQLKQKQDKKLLRDELRRLQNLHSMAY